MTTLTPPPTSLLERYRGEAFKPLYATRVTVAGGTTEDGRASGIAQSDDGTLQLALRMPKALGGPGGGTNPEQLFAAGYAACFHGVLHLLAARASIAVPNMTVDVTVTFGRDPVDGLFMLTADVEIHLPDVEFAVAEELVRNAERVCPYSKMTRQGIPSITLAVQPRGGHRHGVSHAFGTR
jgi:Ohr subfamily peroxiredoxin